MSSHNHFLHHILAWFVSFLLLTPAIAKECAPFTAISDIHFDPFYGCRKGICPLITELAKSDPQSWSKIFIKYNLAGGPSHIGQDTNYLLWKSTLQTIRNSTKSAKVDFVIVLGDFLSHHYKKKYLKYSGDSKGIHYQQFVLKTFKFLMSELQQALPANMPIYPVIGNNDSYGENCRDPNYCTATQGYFFKDLAALFANFIPTTERKSFVNQFQTAGYYQSALPNSPYQLVVLNSIIFSTHAQGRNLPKTAAEELNWLSERLQYLTIKNKQAILVYHIPTGSGVDSFLNIFLGKKSFWRNQYNQTFLQIVYQYAPTIAIILTGHLHKDGYQFLTAPQANQNILDSYVPAISPIYGDTPRFKIYCGIGLGKNVRVN